MKFDEFELDPSILEAISYMGFENATPVQEQTIPEILQGKDLIAVAQTGTGKTAAFMLPILSKIASKSTTGVDTLVIVPTRELAIQIEQQVQGFSYFVGASSKSIYGGGDGNNFQSEKVALSGNADIIVATPGKLISHLNLGYVKFESLKHLVLDEADKMLDMGFFEDIMKITGYLPKVRQTIMFSATMPPKIRDLAKNILTDPAEVTLELSKPAENILQAAYLAYDEQKIPLLCSLLNGKDDYQSIIVFTSTKSMVNEIVRAFKRSHFQAEGISSDLEQSEREQVLSSFRSRQTKILVATDVISRGIDIKEIDLVINFDAPGDAEDYVHRIGRTGRANASGLAITLINPKDMQRFHRIEELIEKEVIKLPVPAELGQGPLYDVNTKPPKRGIFKRAKRFKR